MKALTLTQPWAQEMMDGFKAVETRSWYTNYRGWLAIHAAKGFPRFARDFAEEERAIGRVPPQLPRGAILGMVYLRSCRDAFDLAPSLSSLERYLGDYTRGRYAWQTDNRYKLPEPIACLGALGLWELPPEIERQLLALQKRGEPAIDQARLDQVSDNVIRGAGL